MPGFVGRTRELASLQRELNRTSEDNDQPGRCLFVRGRRRVGKSRLIEVFCESAGVPHVFFTASGHGDAEPDLFAREVLTSDLPGRELFAGASVSTWEAALRLVAAAVADEPVVVVIDEFPYLAADDPSIEATFQKMWDRELSKKPVLLLLVGSDLAMMESLNTYGRPMYQRGTELVVPPLSPVETAEIVGVADAAGAFDAFLVTGGLPLICDEWPTGMTLEEYLEDALSETTSALIVSGERALAAEFPSDALARTVLNQIGAGERTFSNIARAAGGLQSASLNRALDILTAKRIVAREVPLSTSPSKEARYRVADPYLRFWLQFIGPRLPEIERGRGDRVLQRIRDRWSTWRGRAVEPVIREALSRLSPIAELADAPAVGGFWTRSNTPEIDIIGADREPVAKRIVYAGTVKWLDNAPLTQSDVNTLAAGLASVAGASSKTPLVAVSRSGVDATGVIAFGPDELLEAWRTANEI